MMTIERLNELKEWVGYMKRYGVAEGNAVIGLIDAEIKRQSDDNDPTIEEIAKVTGWMLRMREAFKRGDE